MRRRWLVSAVCFLALGAVSTVALCWLVAGVRVEVGTWVWPGDGEGHEASVRRWNIVEERSWCATLRSLSTGPDRPPDWRNASIWPSWSRARDDPRDWHDTYFEGSYGWPWRAMWYRADLARVRFLTSEERIDGGVPIGRVSRQFVPPPAPAPGIYDSRVDDPPAIPIRLAWAFIADAGVHAALWFGLLHIVRAPRWLLAWRRHRRRTCVRCGYDCSATPRRCPECGTEVEGRCARRRPAVFLPAILAMVGAAALVMFAVIGRARFEPRETPMQRAARFGDLEAVRDIIAMGVDGREPIAAEWAAAHDQREIVRSLMPDLGGGSVVRVFDAAIANGHVELAREIRRCASDDDLAADFLFAALEAGQADVARELYETCPMPDPVRFIGVALHGAPPDLMHRLMARVASADAGDRWDSWYAPLWWYDPRLENLEILLEHLVTMEQDRVMLAGLARGLTYSACFHRADIGELLVVRVRRLIDDVDWSRGIDEVPDLIAELWWGGRPDLIVRMVGRLRAAGTLESLVAEALDSLPPGDLWVIAALIHCGVDVVAFDPDGVRAMCDAWEAELANDPSPWLSEVLSLAAIRARLAEFDAASGAGGAGEPRGR